MRSKNGRTVRRDPLQAALVEHLQRIQEGEVSETARRAGISLRQLLRIRAGEADIRLSTLQRLADAMGVHGCVLLGGTMPSSSARPRRPAPIGRRRGKPRAARRQPLSAAPEPFDDDLEDSADDDDE